MHVLPHPFGYQPARQRFCSWWFDQVEVFQLGCCSVQLVFFFHLYTGLLIIEPQPSLNPRSFLFLLLFFWVGIFVDQGGKRAGSLRTDQGTGRSPTTGMVQVTYSLSTVQPGLTTFVLCHSGRFLKADTHGKWWGQCGLLQQTISKS
jgi:hypothetical protein